MSKAPSRHPALAAVMALALVVTGCLPGLLVGGCEGEVADVPSDVRVSVKESVVRCGPFKWRWGATSPVWLEAEPVAWAPGDSRLAFAGVTAAGCELWILDPAAGTGACRLRVPLVG